MRTYKKDFIPYYRDVDRNYTMKLPSVIEYFGIISTFHSAYLGIDPMFMEKRGLGWVLYSWRGEIFSMPKYAENFTVETFAEDIKGRYFMRYYVMYDNKENYIGYCASKWVLIDINKRRLVKIPEEIGSLYRFERENANNIQKNIISSRDEIKTVVTNDTFEAIFPLRYYDIDPNMHVNNVRYVEWAIESMNLKADFLDKFRPEKFSIVYKKEKHSDGNIKILTALNDLTSSHKITDEHGEILCLINFTWTEKSAL